MGVTPQRGTRTTPTSGRWLGSPGLLARTHGLSRGRLRPPPSMVAGSQQHVSRGTQVDDVLTFMACLRETQLPSLRPTGKNAGHQLQREVPLEEEPVGHKMLQQPSLQKFIV